MSTLYAPKGSDKRIKTVNFAGTQETVYERSDWPIPKLQSYFHDKIIAVIGYGSQGYAQSLNARDNGLNIIVGVREDGYSWDRALSDGWIPGESLFNIESATERGNIVMNLLSDAAQSQVWPVMKPALTAGKTLYFSHGLSLVFPEDTHIVPPDDVDVVLVAPKGSGMTVRSLFKEGRGINSSIAVWQDSTGFAHDTAVALGIAIGSGYMYETTFQNEVFSDLVGERGALMGAMMGIFSAQYELLRSRGHSPSEAFNETVEEATQSLFPLIGKHGMEHLANACSTTARRGALDWAPIFKDATMPVFEKLYEKVRDGSEIRNVLQSNGKATYRQDLKRELEALGREEIWRVGQVVRSLRPENQR
ncbi:ketol-acid reductoisomerase [Mucidula mucida]|nr:ketol-acid reductoisomerase [Mucidula mucida]